MRDRDWGWEGASRVGFREGIRIFFVYEEEKGREEGEWSDELRRYDWVGLDLTGLAHSTPNLPRNMPWVDWALLWI